MWAAGSIGANYIEANESLSKKDFLYHRKVCRKEAKETCYWLDLSSPAKDVEVTKMRLMCESIELIKIFSALINIFTTKIYSFTANWTLDFGIWNFTTWTLDFGTRIFPGWNLD
jgi:hypothetical protein